MQLSHSEGRQTTVFESNLSQNAVRKTLQIQVPPLSIRSRVSGFAVSLDGGGVKMNSLSTS